MTRRVNWRDVQTQELSFEECAVRLYDSARLKASKRGLVFNLKYNDVLIKVKKGCCAVTGIPFDMRAKPMFGPDLPFRASLDRIDNTRGYVPDNIAVVCRIYNHSKWNWNEEDVITLAKGVLGYVK